MTTVKATKVSNCEVSISLIEVAEIIRHELNAYGSRSAGVNIAIPPKAKFEIIEGRDSDGHNPSLSIFKFYWQE